MTAAVFDGSAPDWLKALAGLGGLWAIVVSVGRGLWLWFYRPRLVLDVETDGAAHERYVESEQHGETGHWLRAKVHNTGHREARGVRVKLRRWYVVPNDQWDGKWDPQDLDAFFLHWVSLRDSETGRALDAVNLLDGEDWDFVDVCRYHEGTEDWGLRSHDPKPRGYQLTTKARGVHIIDIALYAENLRTTSYRIVFCTCEEHFTEAKDPEKPGDFHLVVCEQVSRRRSWLRRGPHDDNRVPQRISEHVAQTAR